MKIEKLEKLVCSLHDKDRYCVQIRTLRQAINHGLALKKVQEWFNSIKLTHWYEYRANRNGKKNDLEKYVNEQCSFRKNHSKMYKNIKI